MNGAPTGRGPYETLRRSWFQLHGAAGGGHSIHEASSETVAKYGAAWSGTPCMESCPSYSSTTSGSSSNPKYSCSIRSSYTLTIRKPDGSAPSGYPTAPDVTISRLPSKE